MKILIYRGKHEKFLIECKNFNKNDDIQILRVLFEYLDTEGYYSRISHLEQKILNKVRVGCDDDLLDWMYHRKGWEYEGWEYEDILSLDELKKITERSKSVSNRR